MKNNARYFIFLLIMIFLSACGTSPTGSSPDALYTQVSLTVEAQLKLTKVVPTVTPSITVTATPSPTRIVVPTRAITTAPPTKLPSDVESSLVIETLDAFNGHNLRRISGWSDGFNGYQWMGSERLLLYPITGVAEYMTNPSNFAELVVQSWFSYPTVINLDSGKIWLPPTEINRPFFRSRYSVLPVWLDQAKVLLASDVNTDIHTLVYSPDGDLLQRYEGRLLKISSAGSKILLNGATYPTRTFEGTKWIDLSNNKEVVFNVEFSSDSIDSGFPLSIWSADETRVYSSTRNVYGNAETGESFMAQSGSSFEEEQADLIGPFSHSFGVWVLNNSYLLAQWNEIDEGTPGFVSFFDPARKGYRNLSELAGLPNVVEVLANPDGFSYPCNNSSPQATSGGRYVWVNCEDGGRLIDMQTFKAKTYPNYPEAWLKWSADGNFAFLGISYYDPSPQLLSAASNQLKPIPANACYLWHPTQSIFLLLAEDGQTLSLYDASSMSVRQKITLPMAFDCPEWSGTANKLIMLAKDASLWQVDYPTLSHLEQLTKPINGLNGFTSSPDDISIAFPIGKDIYIVDTKHKP